ncbi:MAG TPA: hypothetical protein VI136_26935 [Verrucomicrobiae bacterium]
MVYRQGLAASSGIVLFRIVQPSAAIAAKWVCAILAVRTDWDGHYAVVDDVAVRMRPQPGK